MDYQTLQHRPECCSAVSHGTYPLQSRWRTRPDRLMFVCAWKIEGGMGLILMVHYTRIIAHILRRAPEQRHTEMCGRPQHVAVWSQARACGVDEIFVVGVLPGSHKMCIFVEDV